MRVDERIRPQFCGFEQCLNLLVSGGSVGHVEQIITFDHEVIDVNVEGGGIGERDFWQVRQLLDADDRVEDVRLESLGHEVGDEDGAGQRQNVLDLTGQFADDDGRGDGVSGGS